jgi:hypothetical protein
VNDRLPQRAAAAPCNLLSVRDDAVDTAQIVWRNASSPSGRPIASRQVLVIPLSGRFVKLGERIMRQEYALSTAGFRAATHGVAARTGPSRANSISRERATLVYLNLMIGTPSPSLAFPTRVSAAGVKVACLRPVKMSLRQRCSGSLERMTPVLEWS